MRFRERFLKMFFSGRFLAKIIDNIFMFSNLDFDKYLGFSSYDRRIFFLKKSLLSIGIGHRIGDPLRAERWFLENILINLLPSENEYVFFDVGANIGDYSKMLNSMFLNSKVHCFEPNPKTFEFLKLNLSNFERIDLHNIGFSSKTSDGKLYCYEQDSISGHASLLEGVFLDLYKNDNIVSFPVSLKTIDEFCIENKINYIHFLKIDTEGLELNILQGALEMISKNKISIIQFEFNEMNLINRVLLKDFYKLLENYRFYRLSDGVLFEISEYKSELEIFRYQDIICVSKLRIDFINIIDGFVLK